MFKFYLPILEFIVACMLLYFVPDGIFRLTKRIFGATSDRLEFIATSVRGFLIGTIITLTFLLTFGISYEDFTAKTVRDTASTIRKIVGFDPIDRCVSRAKDVFRFTPMQFVSKASEQGIEPANGHTYTDEEELLVAGWQALILRKSDTPEGVYEIALVDFCSSRIERNMTDF